MKYLITKWFGTFIYEKNVVIRKILFPLEKNEISKRLTRIKNMKILDEEKNIVKNNNVIVNEKRLNKIGNYKPDDIFFKNIEIKPEEFGVSKELIRQVSLVLTKMEVENKLKSEDMQIVQMVNALDDLIHISNLLSERIDSWSIIPTPIEKIQPINKTLKIVIKEIKNLEKQIEDDMVRIAPNISKIAGPIIGARLISLAGSISKIAVLPASTIQILGAEKALFRYKKEGGKPPKHGVLFQHNLINKSPRRIRGRIARILSTKIAIAAKADFFTKKYIADDLCNDLEKRIKEIRT
jgi:nucleolar protein 56